MLYKNSYNEKLSRSDRKFKIWRSAGLMLTYKCSAACKFCYYNCSPSQQGVMPVETAIKAWSGLKGLAGENARVHITGGEPFLYFDRMADILSEGKRLKLGKVEQIETNGSWADDENDIKEKVRFLDAHGMEVLKISCDPFHSEYVESDKVRKLVDLAGSVIGRERVLVRWQEYLDDPVDMKGMDKGQKMEVYRSSYEKYPFRFTSKAGIELGPLFAKKSVDEIAKNNCRKSFMDSKGIHIDPFGNIFSGVCSGMTVNNVTSKSLKDIWIEIDWTEMEFFSVLFHRGPVGLLDEAVKMGYKKSDLYASKCHLCSDLRQFFFDNGRYKKIIKPNQCYLDSVSEQN